MQQVRSICKVNVTCILEILQFSIAKAKITKPLLHHKNITVPLYILRLCNPHKLAIRKLKKNESCTEKAGGASRFTCLSLLIFITVGFFCIFSSNAMANFINMPIPDFPQMIYKNQWPYGFLRRLIGQALCHT